MLDRTIKFRGKRLDDKDLSWCTGYPVPFFKKNDKYLYLMDKITASSVYGHPIVPETLCQFTGMCDRYGREVWEGDIVRYRTTDDRYKKHPQFVNLVISYNENSASFQAGDIFWERLNPSRVEVIGNVFDNPELLSEEHRYKIVNHEKVYFVK